MKDSEIFSKLREILAKQLSVSADSIRETSLLSEELGADSLDTAEIAMQIKEDFAYDIPDEELKQIKTVKDIVSVLTNKQTVGNK